MMFLEFSFVIFLPRKRDVLKARLLSLEAKKDTTFLRRTGTKCSIGLCKCVCREVSCVMYNVLNVQNSKYLASMYLPFCKLNLLLGI